MQSYKCQHCPKNFRSPYNLKKHMVVHTGNREFRCTKCPYNTQKKVILEKHMQLHELIELKPELMVNYTKCDKCDFICENAKVLGVHKRIHNTIDTAKEAGENEVEDPIACAICMAILTTRDEYVEHLLFEHSNYRTHKCHHCSYTSTVQSEISLHLDLHEIQSNESADVHSCVNCGYLTVDTAFLHQHMVKCRATNPVSPVQPPVEEGGEKRSSIHTDIKPFKCPLCNSRVQTPSSLKNHMIAHVKDCKKSKNYISHSCSEGEMEEGEMEEGEMEEGEMEEGEMEEGEMEEGEMVEGDMMHEDEDEEDIPEDAIVCHECDFYTDSEEAMAIHQKIHVNIQPSRYLMGGEEVMEGGQMGGDGAEQ
eukprot:sb/3465926/